MVFVVVRLGFISALVVIVGFLEVNFQLLISCICLVYCEIYQERDQGILGYEDWAESSRCVCPSI